MRACPVCSSFSGVSLSFMIQCLHVPIRNKLNGLATAEQFDSMRLLPCDGSAEGWSCSDAETMIGDVYTQLGQPEQLELQYGYDESVTEEVEMQGQAGDFDQQSGIVPQSHIVAECNHNGFPIQEAQVHSALYVTTASAAPLSSPASALSPPQLTDVPARISPFSHLAAEFHRQKHVQIAPRPLASRPQPAPHMTVTAPASDKNGRVRKPSAKPAVKRAKKDAPSVTSNQQQPPPTIAMTTNTPTLHSTVYDPMQDMGWSLPALENVSRVLLR